MAANVRELGVVKVAAPCHREWDAMTGDARVRFCADCKLNVYNLSEMTTDEAHQLIREKEGRLCVRFYTRDDGTVLTRDCPKGILLKRVKLIAAGSTAVVMSLSALAIYVSGVFSDAESEACSAAPYVPPDRQVLQDLDKSKPTNDAQWMEKRRNQLGPREVTKPHRATMGAMRIVRDVDSKKD